jgi:S1-C subfamily serine protease
MPDASANPLLALSGQLTQIIDGAAGAVVGIISHGRLAASGFVWQSGVVVSASDALEADDELAVLDGAGNTLPAEFAGRDATTDIVVLRVKGGRLEPLKAPVSPGVRVGHLAVALGRGKEGITASLGMVSVAAGTWQSQRGGAIEALVRLDMRLGSRAEGGLVLDAEGRSLGMVVRGPRRRPLVIPIATIERIGARLLKEGSIRRGYLGVGLHPVRLDDALAGTHALEERRASMVVSLDPNGPAQAGGVLVGDIIVGLDGSAVPGVRSLYARLTPESVGKSAQLKIVRAGQLATATVTVAARPAS